MTYRQSESSDILGVREPLLIAALDNDAMPALCQSMQVLNERLQSINAYWATFRQYMTPL